MDASLILDSGNTAWIIVATLLVLLMTNSLSMSRRLKQNGWIGVRIIMRQSLGTMRLTTVVLPWAG